MQNAILFYQIRPFVRLFVTLWYCIKSSKRMHIIVKL